MFPMFSFHHTIPKACAKRMRDVAPRVDNALGHLEAFLGRYGLTLYDEESKSTYSHDLSVMLAYDDLTSISVGLLDFADQILAVHVVDFSAAPCAQGGGRQFDHPTFDATLPDSNDVDYHTGIEVYRNGKHKRYQRWLKIDWQPSNHAETERTTRASANDCPATKALTPPSPIRLPPPQPPRLPQPPS